MTAMIEPPGHVFVIRGDLRNFACDAYLYASDKDLRPGGGWEDAGIDVKQRLDTELRAAYQDERRFTLPARPLSPHGIEPQLILTAVPYTGVKTASEIVPRIREFFEVGSQHAWRRSHMQRKDSIPLLAVPLFGVGGGGAGQFRGEVFQVLHEESILAARTYGIDVAIVLRDARDYDLAQSIRRSRENTWAALSDKQIDDASRLGAQARDSRLVPFMGSGISVSAGAPTWKELIQTLAEKANVDASTAESLAKHHDVLDQAAYLHREYDRRFPDADQTFVEAVVDAVNMPRYGLAPALLSALEAEQAVTLNYDCLFELAAEDGNRPRRVIPGEATEPERWLLKLHGTVKAPSSIVLTRDDYLNFNADRAALSSLVKATLMTRRLLFAGFGVQDPHFHEIIHDVRRALPDRNEPFGTVLTLDDSPTTRRLWEDELEFVVLPSPRLHDIFLDAMLAHAASTHSYLLASGYVETLGSEDTELRHALLAFEASVPAHAKKSSAWPIIETQLRDLGSPPRKKALDPADLDNVISARKALSQDLPNSPGLIAWFRDGKCIYIGISGDLRHRIGEHLSTRTDLSRSTLRSWVAVELLGIARERTRQRPSVITQDEADAVAAWLNECEIGWKVTERRADASRMKDDLLSQMRPRFNRQ
ncbi:SIR2 family protein [Microbacterium natoriense]|uniref:SIR2 family protein n=1 Tax=Microbacterium natoriense TaxID=284570 RepID=UPI0031DDFC48